LVDPIGTVAGRRLSITLCESSGLGGNGARDRVVADEDG
jgi:hypothetical protein